MSDAESVQPIETPAAPDFGVMQSVDEYRKARGAADVLPSDVSDEAVVDAATEPAAKPDAEPDPASEAGKELAKKKHSLKEELGKLRAKIANKDQHISTLNERLAEIDAIKAELAALKTPRPAAEHPTAQPESTTPQPLTGKPTQAQFETYEEYIEALTEWKTEQKLNAASVQAQAQAASREAETALQSIYTKGREAHADFDALLEQQVAEGVRWSPFVTQVVLSSENGHEIAYALAKDPETAVRLSGIRHPAQAGIEMGKFLARLDGAVSGPSSVVAPVTNAPDPIRPVGGTSTGASTADPSEINSVAAWRERRKSYL